MRYYGIYLSDPAKPSDVLIDRRVNKESALALARKLNRQLLATFKGPLQRAPLYYAFFDDKECNKFAARGGVVSNDATPARPQGRRPDHA